MTFQSKLHKHPFSRQLNKFNLQTSISTSPIRNVSFINQNFVYWNSKCFTSKESSTNIRHSIKSSDTIIWGFGIFILLKIFDNVPLSSEVSLSIRKCISPPPHTQDLYLDGFDEILSKVFRSSSAMILIWNLSTSRMVLSGPILITWDTLLIPRCVCQWDGRDCLQSFGGVKRASESLSKILKTHFT